MVEEVPVYRCRYCNEFVSEIDKQIVKFQGYNGLTGEHAKCDLSIQFDDRIVVIHDSGEAPLVWCSTGCLVNSIVCYERM